MGESFAQTGSSGQVVLEAGGSKGFLRNLKPQWLMGREWEKALNKVGSLIHIGKLGNAEMF